MFTSKRSLKTGKRGIVGCNSAQLVVATVFLPSVLLLWWITRI